MTSISEQTFDGPSPVSAAAPTQTLFDSRAVALATFFGTPVAGGILMAINYSRLGNTGKAVTALILSLLATGALIFVGFKIPQGASTIIAVGVMFAMKAIAKSLQGYDVTVHVEKGGKLGSMWTAFWIGLIVLAVLFGLVFLGIYMNDRLPSVVIGSKDEVFYSGTATKQDAQTLGDKLKESGYFSDKGADVVLAKGTDGTSISFIVKEGSWNQIDTVEQFEIIGQQLAPSIGGFPIEVRLLNKDKAVQTNSTIGHVGFEGKDDIYYLGNATEADAEALGGALKTEGFFTGKGSDVLLSKHSDGTMLSFVVRDGVWDDDATVKAFEKIARDAAPSIGGTPLQLRLMNTSLQVKKHEML